MDFASRHIGPSPAEQDHMLGTLGYATLDELTTAALPPALGAKASLAGLPPALSEAQALQRLRDLAAQNQVLTSMIGLGYYGTITPAVIRRNVLENPGWYTAYTPYQPEISQGRLEALLNFQTMIEDLTGLAVAGASLLDEATAAAEAMTLARRAARKGTIFLADSRCLPQTLAVLATRAQPLGIDLVVTEVTEQEVAAQPAGELFGVLLPYPDATGEIRDLRPVIAAAAERGVLSPLTGSRYRPGNSTSGGRRRRATSAPRRCCSRSSPGCTGSTTGRTGSPPSPARCTARRPCSPPRCARQDAPSPTTSSSTRSP